MTADGKYKEGPCSRDEADDDDQDRWLDDPWNAAAHHALTRRFATEPGRYAVVRVCTPVEPEDDATPLEREYVRVAGDGGEDYWIQPDDAGAWSWEDVIRHAIKVDVVRAGIETGS